jgi:DNA-binding PadR family transcriptional regulator
LNNNDNNDQDGQKRRHRFWDNPDSHHEEHFGRHHFGRRGFLRPQILQLLEKQPMNGVDIMNKLQEMSRGWYRPSPGSVYPLLEQLEKEGLITKNTEGKFELTAAYAEQSGVPHDIAGVLSVMESNTSYLEDLQKSDAGSISKSKGRIEKLKKRLEALNGPSQSGSGPQ